MSDLFSLAGRTALVSGGSRGVAPPSPPNCCGGARVLVCARSVGELEDAVARLGTFRLVEGIPADLSTLAGVEALADQVRARTHGALHVLVNNAGTPATAPPHGFRQFTTIRRTRRTVSAHAARPRDRRPSTSGPKFVRWEAGCTQLPYSS